MIRNWFGRRPPEPPGALKQALDELDAELERRPELRRAAETLRPLLLTAFRVRQVATTAPVDRQQLVEGWLRGEPGFRNQPPAFDPLEVQMRGQEVLELLAGPKGERNDLLQRIRSRQTIATDWLDDRLGRRDGEDVPWPEEVDSGLRLCWLATLAPEASTRSGLLPDGLWERPDCPHCGLTALLVESRGLEQRRFHRCGLCGGSWGAPRLGCPGCLTGRSERVEIRYIEEEQDRRRIEHCLDCGRSWKVLSSLSERSAPGLVVADFLSIHLDLLIEELWPGAPPQGR